MFIATTTQLLSLGTILIQVLTIALIVILFVDRGSLYKWIRKNAIIIGLILVSFATLGSLFYSDFVGFEPCRLCWILRMFMFPQVILFAIAVRAGDRGVAKYSLGLSIFGFLIAGYQYLMQIGIVSESCGISGGCSKRLIFEFGYITIPMMTLTIFAFLIALMLFVLIKNKSEKNAIIKK